MKICVSSYEVNGSADTKFALLLTNVFREYYLYSKIKIILANSYRSKKSLDIVILCGMKVADLARSFSKCWLNICETTENERFQVNLIGTFWPRLKQLCTGTKDICLQSS